MFLDEDLEVLVDDGDGEEDTSSGADGAEEVCEHGERSDAEAAERRRRGDVAVQLMDHRVVSVSAHHHLLFLQLLGDLYHKGYVSSRSYKIQF